MLKSLIDFKRVKRERKDSLEEFLSEPKNSEGTEIRLSQIHVPNPSPKSQIQSLLLLTVCRNQMTWKGTVFTLNVQIIDGVLKHS